MGLFDQLAENKRRNEALKKELILKAMFERQQAQGEATPLNQLFNTGQPAKQEVQENLRELFGAPVGPLQEPQQMAVDTAVEAAPDTPSTLSTKTGNPDP